MITYSKDYGKARKIKEALEEKLSSLQTLNINVANVQDAVRKEINDAKELMSLVHINENGPEMHPIEKNTKLVILSASTTSVEIKQFIEQYLGR